VVRQVSSLPSALPVGSIAVIDMRYMSSYMTPPSLPLAGRALLPADESEGRTRLRELPSRGRGAVYRLSLARPTGPHLKKPTRGSGWLLSVRVT
jgi:hypothetical protein